MADWSKGPAGKQAPQTPEIGVSGVVSTELGPSLDQNWELNGENHRMLFLQMAALNFPPFFPLCGYGQSWALQEPTRALLLTAWPPQTPAQARIRKPQVAGKEKLSTCHREVSAPQREEEVSDF